VDKFIARFQYIENEVERSNRHLEEMTLEEMDMLWEESKEREG